MLTESEELEFAWEALSKDSRSDGWLTVPLGQRGARFRGGIAYPGLEETLFVGFNCESNLQASQLPVGSGFRVTVTTETLAPGFTQWACLTRQTEAKYAFFLMMASDIVAALSSGHGQPEATLRALMLSRIRAWQEFMRRPPTGVLPPEREIGLIGELTTLGEFVRCGASAGKVVSAWEGPSQGIQDFQNHTWGVEVKTSLSANGFPAQISSLEQLDPHFGRSILLVAVRLCLQSDGRSLPEIVEETRKLVADIPTARPTLERRLVMAGYLDEYAEGYVRRFGVVGNRVFEVDDNFPSLTRNSVRPEIRAAEYEMDLDTVVSPAYSIADTLARHEVFQ